MRRPWSCCLLLFTRALRVRTVADLSAAAFALTVVAGLHTFRSTVQEAFPINHFLEIAVLALVMLNLSQARPRLSVDLAALVTFVVAALTLESGLLVWVVAVTAWVLGMRGVSTRGVVAMTVLLAGYFVLRFGVLSVGTPGLIERSSGYLFDVLDPPELAADGSAIGSRRSTPTTSSRRRSRCSRRSRRAVSSSR